MNTRIVAGHAAVAGIFMTAWQVAIAMPAGPANTALVVAGLVGPPAFAALSLGLIAAGNRGAVGQPAAPVPAPRRAVTTARRRELTR